MNKTYFGLLLVLLISLALPYLLPPKDFVNYVSTLGATTALAGALFHMLRDKANHDRTLFIADANNKFSLGSSSHMANVAFDKHVLFCEEYVAEMQRTLATLYKDGPQGTALEHARSLYRVQEKYRLWLTPDIEEGLEKFEKALREIGAGADYAEAVRGTNDPNNAEARTRTLTIIYRKFAEVIGFPEWQGEKITAELTTAAVIQQLRAVLGIPELVSLRKVIIGKIIQKE